MNATLRPGGRNGQFAKAKGYRKWFALAGEVIMLERPIPISCPVTFKMILCPPHKQRYDMDNKIKPVLDVLVEHGLIADDNSKVVKDIRVIEGGDFPGALVIVEPCT